MHRSRASQTTALQSHAPLSNPILEISSMSPVSSPAPSTNTSPTNSAPPTNHILKQTPHAIRSRAAANTPSPLTKAKLSSATISASSTPPPPTSPGNICDDPTVTVRDFAYPTTDLRHWGHPNGSSAKRFAWNSRPAEIAAQAAASAAASELSNSLPRHNHEFRSRNGRFGDGGDDGASDNFKESDNRNAHEDEDSGTSSDYSPSAKRVFDSDSTDTPSTTSCTTPLPSPPPHHHSPLTTALARPSPRQNPSLTRSQMNFLSQSDAFCSRRWCLKYATAAYAFTKVGDWEVCLEVGESVLLVGPEQTGFFGRLPPLPAAVGEDAARSHPAESSKRSSLDGNGSQSNRLGDRWSSIDELDDENKDGEAKRVKEIPEVEIVEGVEGFVERVSPFVEFQQSAYGEGWVTAVKVKALRGDLATRLEIEAVGLVPSGFLRIEL
ncbi:hypothetical protein DFJ73DRAFT_833409 [Zopfochytrium polystomum]|nr:hypothetical protein DFJ73DRAFT_833409 [Zopfochytrium polystomum]